MSYLYFDTAYCTETLLPKYQCVPFLREFNVFQKRHSKEDLVHFQTRRNCSGYPAYT